MAEPIFPGLPKDLTALSADELNELLGGYQETVKRIQDRDEELLGDLKMKDVLDTLTSGVEDIEKIREELDARGEAEEQFESELKKLGERAGISEPSAEEKETDEVKAEAETVEETEEAEVEAKEDAEVEAKSDEKVEAEEQAEEPVAEVEAVEPEAVEPEAVEAEPEPVAASAEKDELKEEPKRETRVFSRRPLPKVSKDRQPVAAEASGAAFTASAGIEGVAEGKPLDRLALAEAVMQKRRRFSSTPEGVREEVIVASVDYGNRFPDERRLLGEASDQAKVDAVLDEIGELSEDSLVATGGLCAPTIPYYQLQNISSPERPVRDVLVGFSAVRGGINLAAPPTLAAVTTAVGIKTAANDFAGGTEAAKTCQVVDCPTFSEVELSMIFRCVQYGNLNSRAFPEMIAQFNDLTLAAHARTAETALLDGIAAASTAVTQAVLQGTYTSLLQGILKAAAGMRSRHRTTRDKRFRVIFPEWALDILTADLGASQFYRFAQTRDGVIQALSELARVDITFTNDGETGGGQVFGAQAVGVLDDFPTELIWYIYPEGSFLFLDGGELNLGIVRDSTLNSTNDYQIFGETFENIAFAGVESLKVTSTVCPSGEAGLVDDDGTGITC